MTARPAASLGWLKSHALPLWWEHGADHLNGGFHEALNGFAKPVGSVRRARVQTRQIFVYSTAGLLGWEGPWQEAVGHGLEFFLKRFQRSDGLYCTSLNNDGTPADESAWLYEQAFALLAFAAATKSGARDLTSHGRALGARIATFQNKYGGFREYSATHPYQSNPQMHLLEACLAWEELEGGSSWMALSDSVAELAMRRMLDEQGAVHEYFNEEWELASGTDGRIIEPGHQFEWAWLLERWARARSREDGHRAARRLHSRGLAGVDSVRGVANQQLLDDGTVIDPLARLWPQTEWMKSAHIFGDKTSLAFATNALSLYLDRTPAGLWWEKLQADGTFRDEPAPATSFYHIACALSEVSGNSAA